MAKIRPLTTSEPSQPSQWYRIRKLNTYEYQIERVTIDLAGEMPRVVAIEQIGKPDLFQLRSDDLHTILYRDSKEHFRK